MTQKVFARIVREPISPEAVVNLVRTSDSGCVVTYVGLIRDNSHGKAVRSVEYSDPHGTAEQGLKSIVEEAMRRWPLNAMAIYHRVGVLNVNDINLTVAIGVGHRGEGLAACAFAVDEFKAKLPTTKKETYADGTVYNAQD
ncbi:MAG: molybdenum cofactor biosynthesis protein MoaE [Dehalococcoidia bacterium]|nr:MAG: molybdenum cofactor biosynthesis protein MoaE [Dehalococcoidia bacterium]